MGAKTIEVKSSHLSLISHPDEITRLILEAAGQRSERGWRFWSAWKSPPSESTYSHQSKEKTMKRFGSAAWSGNLRDGKGSVSTESHALEGYPYTYFSRGEKQGTNPEELLSAAHAACFSMSFVRILGMSHYEAEQLDSRSEVVIDKDADGFAITSVHLSVIAKIPGIDDITFQSIAMKAKFGCPVSKLMNTNISFEARLVS
jgi:lipoyl-dependent peroxiredoxin